MKLDESMMTSAVEVTKAYLKGPGSCRLETEQSHPGQMASRTKELRAFGGVKSASPETVISSKRIT